MQVGDQVESQPKPPKKRWGRRIVFGCCGCLVLVVLAIGSCAGFLALKEAKYDPLAIPYIEDVMPDLTTWEPLRFEQHFAPEVLEQNGHDRIAPMFNWYSVLGALRSFETPEFHRISKSLGVPYSSVVTYTVRAEFERGPALITFNLVPVTDEELKVFGVFINSDALIPEGNSSPDQLRPDSLKNPSV